MDINFVLEELKKREPIFHRPEMGLTKFDLENMIAEGFTEISASGKWYTREYVILTTLERVENNFFENDVWETGDFVCRQIAPNLYLLNYVLLQNKQRKTLRSTIWRWQDPYWKIVFHQGSVCNNA